MYGQRCCGGPSGGKGRLRKITGATFTKLQVRKITSTALQTLLHTEPLYVCLVGTGHLYASDANGTIYNECRAQYSRKLNALFALMHSSVSVLNCHPLDSPTPLEDWR